MRTGLKEEEEEEMGRGRKKTSSSSPFGRRPRPLPPILYHHVCRRRKNVCNSRAVIIKFLIDRLSLPSFLLRLIPSPSPSFRSPTFGGGARKMRRRVGEALFLSSESFRNCLFMSACPSLSVAAVVGGAQWCESRVSV